MQASVLFIELISVARYLTKRGAQAGRTIAGQTNQAGLLVKRSADGLANPECCIGGELEPLAPVELVDGVLEAEVSFLDQVEQLHARGQWVAAGDADNESEVRSDEAVLGHGGGADLAIEFAAAFATLFDPASCDALFDDLGKLTLFGSVEQRYCADFVQVLTY